MSHHHWMIVAGSAMVGWLLVEAISVGGRVRVPVGMNIMGAVAGALLAAGMVT